MSLRRVGGKSDGGVDLLGWWWLPPRIGEPATPNAEAFHNRTRLRVLAQCKAEKKKTAPKYIRELEGVAARLSSPESNTTGSPSSFPVVSLFVSESAFTRATLLRAHSSAFPFFLLHIPPHIPRASNTIDAPNSNRRDSDSDASRLDGEIGTALWNPALSRILGERMQVRWEVPQRTHDDQLSSAFTSVGVNANSGSSHGGRPGVWYQSDEGHWSRLRNWTPESSCNHVVAQDDVQQEEEFAEKVRGMV